MIERRDFYLPYLRLVKQLSPTKSYPDRARPAELQIGEADAPVALEALCRVTALPSFPFASEARSAFRKLAFDLDPDAFSRDSPVLFADQPHNAEVSDNIRLLSDALLSRKRVKFRYHGIYKGEESKRDVDGYGLLFQSGHWYFIGHDRLRADVRVFRVGRMDDDAPNKAAPNTADYTVPADFSLGKYVGRQPWELGDRDEQPITARVLFRFPLSLWAERNAHGVEETRHDDGSVVRLFPLHQVNPFLRWLLGLQNEVEIMEPDELRNELREMARRVVKLHAEVKHERD